VAQEPAERTWAISGVSHLGVQVADIERSVAFYGGTLGLELVWRVARSEKTVQEIVALPNLEVEVAVFRVPGTDCYLEVLEYRNVERAAVDPATQNPGTGHLCLYVDDLDALHAELQAQGIPFLSHPKTPAGGPHAGGRVVYMLDPDGFRIELLQTESTLAGENRFALRRALAAAT
jgi:lactoylglutathione lyase